MSDLWHSVREIARSGSPRLRIGARGIVELVEHSPTGNNAITAMDGRTVSVEYVDGVDLNVPGLVGQRVAVGRGGIIWPLVPLPFLYEPYVDGPDQLRAYAERIADLVRQNIAEQGQVLEQRHQHQGFRAGVPSMHRDSDDLRRFARRLYRHAVLGQGWSRIADEEAEEWPDPRDPQAVRATVNQWAKTLNVRLSPLPRGRPRTARD